MRRQLHQELRGFAAERRLSSLKQSSDKDAEFMAARQQDLMSFKSKFKAKESN